ncbi:MAG TPA: 1-phosphofructokinase [Lactovum miscens]|uniref:1-phosphofructokinase n=1 Tax=Lactovum miscens TaxID=190387 RepID=UPI002ED7EB96
MIFTVTLNPALDYFMEYHELENGLVNRTKLTRMTPGGKGIMESRMLSSLDVPNTALGFIGGFTGKFIRESLEQQGIKTDFTQVFGQTRINVKIKTRSDETSLDAAGPDLTSEDVNNFLTKFDTLQEGDIVAFAGTVPKSLGENFYDLLIRLVKTRGAEFAIDIDGQKLLKTLLMKPLIIKPNVEELEEIFSVKFSKKDDIFPYGQKLLSMGAQNVIVSMAGDGALLFTKEKVYFAQPIKGIIKNSVGAGDSTVAGFLAEWSQSHDVLTAFKQGVACGTAKVFSEDMPSARFIQKCYEQIKIEEVSNGD